MAKTDTKNEQEKQAAMIEQIVAAAGEVESVTTSYDDKQVCYVTTVTLTGKHHNKKCKATGATATEAISNAVTATKTYVKSL